MGFVSWPILFDSNDEFNSDEVPREAYDPELQRTSNCGAN